MTNAQKKIVRALRKLEQSWPKDGTMIMANGNFLYLCTNHPEGGGKVLDSFRIPSDGGDPDWNGDDEALRDERERAAKIAENPYGDEVQAFAGDEPKAVGHKIAAAIRKED